MAFSPQLSSHSRTSGETSTSCRLPPVKLACKHAGVRNSAVASIELTAPTQTAAGKTPKFDYVARLRQRQSDPDACPPLFLAPMENLADRPFRRAMVATVGGFDEACTEFIRVPSRTSNPGGSIRGITAWYDPGELGGVPLGAQIMGSDPELMGLAAQYLVQVKGAPRVDLNCGCPANTVTGNGAGSSLLRTPALLGDIVRAMVVAVGGAAPVSVKLRAGFNDTALLEDNMLAAQEGGASFITLHPRTKKQCYDGSADWSLTARAVELLDIPVIGNGDVVSVERALALLRETGCHGVMVGRGAVQDPLIFHRIRHSFLSGAGRSSIGAGPAACSGAGPAAGSGAAAAAAAAGGDLLWPWREPEVMQDFIRSYASQFIPEIAAPDAATTAVTATTSTATTAYPAGKFGRLKKVIKYLFASSPELAAACEGLLRVTPDDCSAAELVERLCGVVGRYWPAGGPSRLVLYDHMNKSTRELAGTGAVRAD